MQRAPHKRALGDRDDGDYDTGRASPSSADGSKQTRAMASAHDETAPALPLLPADCWRLIFEHVRELALVAPMSVEGDIGALARTCKRLRELIRGHSAVVTFFGPGSLSQYRESRRLDTLVSVVQACALPRTRMREFLVLLRSRQWQGNEDSVARSCSVLPFYHLASMTTAQQRAGPDFCVTLSGFGCRLGVSLAQMTRADREFVRDILRTAHTLGVRGSLWDNNVTASMCAKQLVDFLVHDSPPRGTAAQFPRILIRADTGNDVACTLHFGQGRMFELRATGEFVPSYSPAHRYTFSVYALHEIVPAESPPQ
jgi:hypothetical protein